MTVTKPTIAGLLWEVNKGKRSRVGKRLVLEIRGETKSNIAQGLEQLRFQENQGLIKVPTIEDRFESVDDWRYMMKRHEWENYQGKLLSDL
ncbi:uncharacterized protein IL334_006502 [Kwoniella shivajii]|uniref:Uncharacterized protein n=1 Tax=Kwoniella shivajii TaxID=564305 RepID=A0ABZ1D967_9TREE|nr:hypothetical protein IL334_006502 [Kwoniella shivajii]